MYHYIMYHCIMYQYIIYHYIRLMHFDVFIGKKE